jgi:hypothetical protein
MILAGTNRRSSVHARRSITGRAPVAFAFAWDIPQPERHMELDRDTVATAIVGTGGAWMLGAAVLNSRSGHWNAAQLKGLVLAGTGFLMTAAAAHYLQSEGVRGIAVSLLGTALAMRGMYMLVRERLASKQAERKRRSGSTHE